MDIKVKGVDTSKVTITKDNRAIRNFNDKCVMKRS